MEKEVQLIKPFGPSILEMNCDLESIDNFNKFLDQMSEEDKKMRSSKTDKDHKNIPDLLERSFEILYLTNNDLLETKIHEQISYAARQYLNFFGTKNLKVYLPQASFSEKFVDVWVNNYDKDSITPPHRHRGFLSGVIILQLPKTESINCLQYIWNNEIYNPEECVGKLLLFPNHLIHWVRRQHSGGRKTLSFNLFAEENNNMQ